ncbi:putative ATP-dependent RNA helicase ucp12 [Coemansia sp. RSA 1199]|nr:putative ATP-dependent RNA helicase ucp12 [Coemansia sp. RSA 1199]
MGGKAKKAAPVDSKTKKTAEVESKPKKGAQDDTKPKPAENPAQALFGKWTGKTPVTLLNEFVQKNAGWHKPEYLMHGGPNSYNCTIRLSKSDKKQPTPISVHFKPEATDSTLLKHKTSLEARHVAATFVLHRLRSDTNLHRMLPPVHREYWLDLEKLRQENTSEWVYVADPFAAKIAREKHFEERAVKQAKKREQVARAEAGHKEELLPPGQRRRWEEMAEVGMSERHRETVEAVVRTWTSNWGVTDSSSEAGGDPGTRNALIKQGFREVHVDEALGHTTTREQALDWLCVHVPEDDLPQQVMQRAYRASATVVTSDERALSVQLAAKRLARAGFPTSKCKSVVEQKLDEQPDAMPDALAAAEARAAHELLAQLCERSLPLVSDVDEDSVRAAVDDEVQMLDAIYTGEGRISRPNAYQINVDLRPPEAQLCGRDAQLVFWLPPGLAYPEHLPAVAIVSDQMPAYLKLHVARQLNAQLNNDGMPVLFEAVSMAEQMVEEWLRNPPLLAGLLGAMAPEQTKTVVKATKRNVQKKTVRVQDTQRLCAEFERLQVNTEYQRMQKARDALPAAAQQEHIAQLVADSRCVVVAGATGCGKTTQVPQFILDQALKSGDYVNIVCTQPRRISAIGVAARVASERAEDINAQRGGSLVGYAVRGESRQSRDTRLLFCTTGVLLRMLVSTPDLESVTHVVCDEVHERSVDSDLLLVLLRQCLQRNPRLRVVLMSATAQCEVFAGYFGSNVPVVTIPGRTFPVEDVYVEDFIAQQSSSEMHEIFGAATVGKAKAKLANAHERGDNEWLAHIRKMRASGCNDTQAACVSAWDDRFGQASGATLIDYEMIGSIINHIHTTAPMDQAVLVFMPGVAEIQACIDVVQRIARSAFVLPLHAGLASGEQQRVFGRAPQGQRKIVVATNVAETSITIEDIGFVIDSGRVREVRMDHVSRVARLITTFCSQAAAMQRRGRAGRRQRGTCYRVYTRRGQDRVMPMHTMPEILRTPLEQVCLQAKDLGYPDTRAFLDSALDAPDAVAVDGAERLLVAVGACERVNGPLAGLGRLMAQIPLDLRLAKTLVFGAMLNVLERTLRVVAIMALDRPLFSSSFATRDTARNSRMQCAMGRSDWLADLCALERSLRSDRPDCVSPALVREARNNIRTLRQCVDQLGLAPNEPPPVMPEAEELRVLQAVITAGLSPNIARVRVPQQKFQQVSNGTIAVDREARELAFYAVDETHSEHSWRSHDVHKDRRVFVHPQSTMFAETKYSSPFVAYLGQSANGQKTFLRDVTAPGVYGVLMFGPRVRVDHECKVVVVGCGGLAVRAWPRIGVLVGQLRMLLDELLRRKLDDPRLSIHDHPVVLAVLDLVRSDGR